MKQTQPLLTKLLRRETVAGEYNLYKAGLEWDLIDPIVIESRDDLKSQTRWQDRIKPFHHQVTNLMTFCRRLPVTLLADDVGLGKTVSAGLIVSELAARSRIQTILVVAPKLLGPQWKEELQSKFSIPAEVAIGRDLETVVPKGLGAVITTYNTARLYLDKLPPDRFRMLILDEAHKLRNLHGTEKPPQVALRFQKALLERRFRYVLMLTATPIQNRLWDLYSLVDLLSVARGHENPFGSAGMFARRFIADDQNTARRLKLEAKNEFQSIVYGYMSRVRRGDAKLYFPSRIVRMERVQPSRGELDLIEVIAGPIQRLNRLVQISILQALTSSPEALSAQLQKMGEKGTVPAGLAAAVKGIVENMPTTAKLRGLGALIERLKKEDPQRWRLVVFTTRRETQTTIEAFLSDRSLKVGVINGNTAGRNQETLQAFRANPPGLNVIVSTEAGSEGVNLQVANILVNYDLPWNPMIVEQRIGRVQRLASAHANVSIFNMMLTGTFEEYIVGRLMEKLQLASHAIGDIESLLEASGIGDDDGGGFDERLRQLVVVALAGKDYEKETRLVEQSIENAKVELERERDAIDAMLGNMDGSAESGPRAPKLPPIERSMDAKAFVLASYRYLGASISTLGRDRFLVEQDGSRHEIVLSPNVPASSRAVLHEPGSAAFARLVARISGSGVHKVRDDGASAENTVRDISRQWADRIDAKVKALTIAGVEKRFTGRAIVRVRALVQHDSYERLVSVSCDPAVHHVRGDHNALRLSSSLIEDVSSIGIDKAAIRAVAEFDPGVSEFCRFYLERRAVEEHAAADDDRKRHKLREDFTPRLEMSVVGLEGSIGREAEVKVSYLLDGGHEYADALVIDADNGRIVSEPELRLCALSGKMLPVGSLGTCCFTGAEVLRHRLAQSESSGRYAHPEFAVRCSLSGKRVLKDEVEPSAVTGALILRSLLWISDISGKRAEPSYFLRCGFTGSDILAAEVATSEISGKSYRADQSASSDISGKSGHISEFIVCHETEQSLALVEAERCEVTGHLVRPGVLVECALTKKRVLKNELEASTVTGALVLKSLLRTSAVSGRRAEASCFSRCDFTDSDILANEAETSEISGKRYRVDQGVHSDVSGKAGHSSEFVTCYKTGQSLALAEAEQCEVTGHSVRLGMLADCAVTKKRVLPGELRRCAITSQMVLPEFLVESSISGRHFLKGIAVASSNLEQLCAPDEVEFCSWSGRGVHPADTVQCRLTGLRIHRDYIAGPDTPALKPLSELLDGVRHSADRISLWPEAATCLEKFVRGRIRVEAAELSPHRSALAIRCEVRTLLGFRTRLVGALFSLEDYTIIGRVVEAEGRSAVVRDNA